MNNNLFLLLFFLLFVKIEVWRAIVGGIEPDRPVVNIQMDIQTIEFYVNNKWSGEEEEEEEEEADVVGV
jgi:hypothetical protein